MVENLEIGSHWKNHMIIEEKQQEHKYIMHIHIVQVNEEAMKMQTD